jgi:hypothetical protein
MVISAIGLGFVFDVGNMVIVMLGSKANVGVGDTVGVMTKISSGKGETIIESGWANI